MPQPLPATLSEMRASVMTRSGLSTVNDVNARHRSLIDEFLRKAQRYIYLKATWARMRRAASFASQDEVTDYDIPDDTTVGGIYRLVIVDVDGVEDQLVYDDVADLQALTLSAKGKPQYYRIIDDVIRVLPKVDAAAYPTFRIEYELAPQPLVNDQDRPAVDSEAMVQHATMAMRSHMGIEEDPKMKMLELQEYLELLKQQVNPGRMYSMASRTFQGPAYYEWNGYPTGIGTGPYWSGWSPW